MSQEQDKIFGYFIPSWLFILSCPLIICKGPRDSLESLLPNVIVSSYVVQENNKADSILDCTFL